MASNVYTQQRKINKVRVEIKIYNLQTEELISHKSIDAVIDRVVTTEDNLKMAQSIENMQLKSLKKIIRSYKNEFK